MRKILHKAIILSDLNKFHDICQLKDWYVIYDIRQELFAVSENHTHTIHRDIDEVSSKYLLHPILRRFQSQNRGTSFGIYLARPIEIRQLVHHRSDIGIFYVGQNIWIFFVDKLTSTMKWSCDYFLRDDLSKYHFSSHQMHKPRVVLECIYL